MRRLVGVLALALGMSTVAAPSPAPAQAGAAACESLTASAVRYPSPVHTGALAEGAEACFTLPDGEGTVYEIAANIDEIALTAFEVRDAEGAKICEGGGICRLTGTAPFRFRMAVSYATAYELQIFRITGDHGCPRIAVQPYGSPSEVTGRFDGNLQNCFSFTLPEGAAPLFSSGFTALHPYLEAYDADGDPVCISRSPECVDVSEEPREIVLLAGRITGIYDPPGGRYRFTLANLTGTDGCLPALDTSWTAPAASRTATSSTQLDCWLLPSAEGEPVVFGTRAPNHNVRQFLLDADGHFACHDTLAGCHLAGPPPYRLIAATTYIEYKNTVAPTTYRAAVRSMAPGSGCSLITPRPYGVAATDRHPGNGCRQFDVLPGHTYFVTPVDPDTRKQAYRDVLDADLQAQQPGDGCFGTNPVCADLTPGRHFLITDVIEADTVTTLHDLADPRGCEALAPDLTQGTGPQPLAAVDCYALQSLPGDQVDVVSTAASNNFDEGYRIVDALGDDACDYFSDLTGYCKLVGPAPYRLLVGSGSSEPYVVGVVDAVDPPECVPVELGPRSGRIVVLDASDRIECFTAATAGDEGVEAVHVQRLAGTGGAILTNYPNGACSEPEWDPEPPPYFQGSTMLCERPVPGDEFKFVVVGNGTSQAFYVQRTENSPDPGSISLTGMYVRVLPQVKGAPRPGSRLRAEPGKWDPTYPKVRYRYQWLVNDRPIEGATGQRFLVQKRFVGKSVRVMVTAVAPSFRSGFAFSSPRKVRR